MPRVIRLALLCLVALLAACGTPQAASPTAVPAAQPAAAPTAAAPTAAPTTNPNLPTPPPRVTPAPTAAPFPLEAGWWDGAVCYEIFVRSFYDSDGDGIGDLSGLIEKLDYVNDGDPETANDLGTTCVWLMPIMPATSYHGYDVTDYYAVNPEYGTADDFKRFVEAANERGIKVILDLVLNHTSREHPWFQEALRDPESPYRDWYLWSKEKPSYKGPFGNEVWHRSTEGDEFYYGLFWEGMPDLNYRNPAVTAEAQKISAFWLNEMGVDGFRLDAIKHLIEYGAAQEDTEETHAWLRGYRAFMQRTKPGSFTIGEIFGGNPALLASYYPDQNDMYFEFDVARSIVGAANGGSATQFLQAADAAFARLPFQRWAPFLTNHDQNRAMATFGGDVSKAKVAATALLTLPGLPFIYYGEEIGMVGVKPDEQIRTPMQWSGDEQGGFTAGSPWQPLQPNAAEVNVAAQEDDPESLLNHYRRLVKLHTGTPALARGDFAPLTASDSGVAAFLRVSDDDAALVVINFDRQPLEGVTLSADAGPLMEGSYALEALLGEAQAAPLAVGAGGSIDGYVPLAELAPRTGYVFRLRR